MKKKSISRLLLLLSCLVLLLPACGPQREKHAEGESEKIVARVNDRPIYERQVDEEVEKHLQKYKKYGMRNAQPQLVRSLKKTILDQMIDRELIYQASRKSLKLDTTEIEKKVEEAFKSMKETFGSEDKFQDYLQANNLTAKQLEAFARKKISIAEYLKSQGVDGAYVADQEIRNFYEQRKDSFRRAETIKVSHILLSVGSDAEPAEKARIRQKAEALRRLIVEGKDFAEAAEEYSDSAEAKQTGGDLGYIKRGFMPPEFDRVAFSLQQGEVSEVVATRFGYHIIVLHDHQPAGVMPYAEVKEFIRKYLLGKKAPEMIAAQAHKLRQQADVEIFLN